MVILGVLIMAKNVAKRIKRVPFENLVIGKTYYTECGCWQGFTTYVGAFQVGKRIKYRFTYGSADNWRNQFGHFETKSGIRVYEEEDYIKAFY
jgi:hypothetical protein